MLSRALTDHVMAEHPALLRMAAEDRRLLERGQQRLVDLVVALAAAAAADDQDCRCAGLADNLLAELTLQADEERRHLFAAAD